MSLTLEARRRVGTGKGAGRRIRSNGLAPAVLYGHGGEAVNLAVDPRDVKRILATEHGMNSTFTLSVNGGETVAVAKIADLQKHPVKRSLVHVDLLRLDPERALEVKVPLNLSGVGPAQKMGARIRHVTREIRVRCKPALIPAAITVDTSTLEPATSVKLADVKVAPGLELVYSHNALVVEAGPVVIVAKTETDDKAKKPAKGKK